jgi:uncharacterized cupin superfamily protein
MYKKISIETAPTVVGSRYPIPYDEPCKGRLRHRLGDAADLTHFGVNLTCLAPGSWSSQRHWHTAEDEFIFVVEGELVLITDLGEETLSAGECAGFRAGDSDGHHCKTDPTGPLCTSRSAAAEPTTKLSIPILIYMR